MSYPKVSCICPTFARVGLLEEAIQCFLQQDYAGEKELVVVNDFVVQTLSFEHPEVRVINLPERATTLGMKRHLAYQEATGHYCMTWGDDDIHLPHRVQRMVSFATQNQSPVALEGWHYVTQEDGVFLNRWSTCGAHIVEREFYNQVGGIPQLDVAEDIEFNKKCLQELGIAVLPYATVDPGFVYRWHGTRRPHVSVICNKDPYAKMLERAYTHVREGHEPAGPIKLNPVLRSDYQELVSTAILR